MDWWLWMLILFIINVHLIKIIYFNDDDDEDGPCYKCSKLKGSCDRHRRED